MSAPNRTWNASTVLAFGVGLFLIGASWFWAARTEAIANREVNMSLRIQSAQMVRVLEKVDALEQTCAQAARVSGAVAVAVQRGAQSPDQVERLSAAVAAQVAEAKGAVPPPELAHEPTPENLAAAESAQKLVSAAVGVKHWTEADRDQLRLLMPQMTTDQYVEVQRQLSMAINRQEVRIDIRGSLF